MNAISCRVGWMDTSLSATKRCRIFPEPSHTEVLRFWWNWNVISTNQQMYREFADRLQYTMTLALGKAFCHHCVPKLRPSQQEASQPQSQWFRLWTFDLETSSPRLRHEAWNFDIRNETVENMDFWNLGSFWANRFNLFDSTFWSCNFDDLEVPKDLVQWGHQDQWFLVIEFLDLIWIQFWFPRSFSYLIFEFSFHSVVPCLPRTCSEVCCDWMNLRDDLWWGLSRAKSRASRRPWNFHLHSWSEVRGGRR